jgi:hypothetical protein
MTTPTFDIDKPLLTEQPMKSPLNDYVWDLDAIERAKDYISIGFDWERSPQGRVYWMEVMRNLSAVARHGAHMEAENAPPCQ